MNTIWDYIALRLREKKAEADWRALVMDGSASVSEPRIVAWRTLERLRSLIAEWEKTNDAQ